MHLQEWIHKITEGSTATRIRFLGLILGFIAVAIVYNMHNRQGFPAQEAMDAAQIARNLADGKGYTTFSIRPLEIALLNKQSPKGKPISIDRVPEVNTPPVYPALLAGLFKLLPYQFHPKGPQISSYALESWIAGFNQTLFFAAILLLFYVARILFDNSVAWVSSLIFAATELYWQFSASGLCTMLLIVIFLGIVLCVVKIEERKDQEKGLLFPALAAGVLLAVGSLTAYSFAWLVVPVVLFLYFSVSRQRYKICLAIALPFLILTAPWLVRNYSITGNAFGTAGYAIFQNTPSLPGDTLERSLNTQIGPARVGPRAIINKFIIAVHSVLQNDVPKLGGNWVSIFFLVGLLIPFRKPTLSKIRFFLLGSLFTLMCAQALGQTHLTDDSPVINSENLLVLAAPLVFIFGTALFFTLIDQISDTTPQVIKIYTGFFVLVVSAPLILYFLSPARSNPNALDTYSINLAARWSNDKELMMSDVPSAMAWYGRQPCAWLTLNDADDFSQLHALAPLHSLYLSAKTTDNMLSQTAEKKTSWEHFALECWTSKEVPDQFPLTKAPAGFTLDRIYLSDKETWR